MQAPAFTYRFREPYAAPEVRGGSPPSYERVEADGVLIERDVGVLLRDGSTIYVDVFRPLDERPAPPLIGWSPYGKHGHVSYDDFPGCGVRDDDVSPYTAFEGPDPLWWVAQGYAVINADPRGLWYSEGEATYVSPEEAQDYCELVEWAGTRPWSNGHVGLTGVSYLAVSQWHVAALQPPHLAAINPCEGWTDLYREVARHGGMPETRFWPFLVRTWGFSTSMIEDLRTETRERPLFDEYWQSKCADLTRVRVPAFVVASWADQGLHLRGTLEGFTRIASEHKWLDVHGQKKWAYYYSEENAERLRAFFDRFLKGTETSVSAWPRVRLEIRQRSSVVTVRAASDWPLPDADHATFHLDAATGTLQPEPVEAVSSVSYDALGSGPGAHRAVFDLTFETATDVVGHMAAHLWMAAEAASDLDIFVAVTKLDCDGEVVPFIYYSQFEDGPVALGWLRASHRELDPQASSVARPVQAHARAAPAAPGAIVPLDVEIWPSATRFEAGETLRLVVQGTDVYKYPRQWRVQTRHEDTVNAGTHVIYTGGGHDSHLVVPLVTPI
jgi:uncharacterized protein